jgi:flagellar biogenesis protein FliO
VTTDLLQILLSGVVVLALIYASAKLYEKYGINLAQKPSGEIKVVDSVYLGKHGRLFLVEAEGQISLLAADNSTLSVIWTREVSGPRLPAGTKQCSSVEQVQEED